MFKIFFSLALFLISFYAEAAKIVPVWTYYTSSPFITGTKQGLSFDFINLLNQYARDKYIFKLEILPRHRIDRLLNTQKPGIVLFVNPIWMKDKYKSKYLWSPAILEDRNEIISRNKGSSPVKINYFSPYSLKNFVFGGLIGHIYPELEKAFTKGEIIRRDVRTEQQLLQLLLRERIDVATITASVLHYEIKKQKLENNIYISPNPLYSYTRHLLIVKELGFLVQFINDFVKDLNSNQEWQKIKENYAIY